MTAHGSVTIVYDGDGNRVSETAPLSPLARGPQRAEVTLQVQLAGSPQ
jgi:hypothetical protein